LGFFNVEVKVKGVNIEGLIPADKAEGVTGVIALDI
jgi:hypothetical protein